MGSHGIRRDEHIVAPRSVNARPQVEVDRCRALTLTDREPMNRPAFRIAVQSLSLIFCLASAAAAQATGTVRGFVRDSTNSRGIAGAQVQLVGSTRGAIADSTGEYIIRDVTAGNHTVRAQRIGYASGTRSVT